jgi:SAM-dependent methyltransferase
MSELNIIKFLHEGTKRDYYARMNSNKPACMKIAREFGKEYFDGYRSTGYGGYYYDGRFKAVAKALKEKYDLDKNSKILDFGCGKGFLMHDLKDLLGCVVRGIDISDYASHTAFSLQPISKNIFFQDDYDLIISLGTLHSLRLYELTEMLRRIQDHSRHSYITVDSYRTEEELCNLQCWTLTCRSFFTPSEWIYLFKEYRYTGDYEFLFFE